MTIVLHPALRADIIGELSRRFVADTATEVQAAEFYRYLADHKMMVENMETEHDYYVEDGISEDRPASDSLDTLPREIIADTAAQILVGMEWPCGVHSNEYCNKWLAEMHVALGDAGMSFRD